MRDCIEASEMTKEKKASDERVCVGDKSTRKRRDTDKRETW